MDIFINKEKWLRYNRGLFALVFGFIFFLAFLNIYFMNMAVFKSTGINSCLQELARVKKEFQDMEIVYISKMNELSLSYARSLGFVGAEPDFYIHSQKAVVQNTDYGNFR